MLSEENQKTIIEEENSTDTKVVAGEPVSAEPKQKVVEVVPTTEEIPVSIKTSTEEKIIPPEQIKNQTEQVENSETKESKVFLPMTEIINGEPKQTQPTEPTEQPQEEKTKEIPQTKTESTQQTQNETPQQTQTQEIPATPQQPQIKTVKNEISSQDHTSLIAPSSSAPPRGTTFSQDFVFNLLNKARAKIQERKRKKLDKIMSLFELNSEISNSNIQKLLRTTKRSATRYLNILEKEHKITQVGVKGRSVKYIKKQ